MLKNIRVLDEREIFFNITEGTLEVFDQNENLVGERPLPIPVEPNMDVNSIYSIAEQCGYNISDMISDIIGEAVMENRTYDVWLQETSMIFYSPSAGQFVSEPYVGLFSTLEQVFASQTSQPVEGEVEEEEYVEEEGLEEDYQTVLHTEDYETNDNPLEDEELVSDDLDPEDTAEFDNEVDPFEQAYKRKFNQPLVEEEFVEEPVYGEDELESEGSHVETQYEEDTMENQDLVPARGQIVGRSTRPAQVETTPSIEEVEEPEVEVIPPQPVRPVPSVEIASQNTGTSKTKEWKQAYTSVLRDNRTVDGVSIKDLRDKVVEIVLAKNADVFDINETEVLLELMEASPVIIDGKTVVKAGLYQAYLLLRDED